jgi:hypothetical protein
VLRRSETRHHAGPERAANGERGKGLPLPFERQHQRSQPARNEDQRPKSDIPKIEFHDVVATIGRAAGWLLYMMRPLGAPALSVDCLRRCRLSGRRSFGRIGAQSSIVLRCDPLADH